MYSACTCTTRIASFATLRSGATRKDFPSPGAPTTRIARVPVPLQPVARGPTAGQWPTLLMVVCIPMCGVGLARTDGTVSLDRLCFSFQQDGRQQLKLQVECRLASRGRISRNRVWTGHREAGGRIYRVADHRIFAAGLASDDTAEGSAGRDTDGDNHPDAVQGRLNRTGRPAGSAGVIFVDPWRKAKDGEDRGALFVDGNLVCDTAMVRMAW